MDLKSRLNIYLNNSHSMQRNASDSEENSIISSNSKNNANKPESYSCLDIHHIVNGEVVRNEQGSFYSIEKHYPLTYIYGDVNLGEAKMLNLESLDSICKINCKDISINDLLFLDTETTGLSGGTGTHAFLIGIAYFTEDSFVIKQYFMRDYDEEPAILEALNSDFAAKKGLVTFNGKSFDINLINTRFTYNRFRSRLKDPVHIDLLYPSRMLWKRKLASCRLVSLEENILDEVRVDDIPGALIPEIYFKYLSDRDAREIVKVIAHNEKDILAMVSLLVKICSIFERPLEYASDCNELNSIADIFLKRCDYENAQVCYSHNVRSDELSAREESLKKLSYISKRNKDYQSAVDYLKNVIEISESSCIPALIELAKLHEHKLSDISAALNYSQTAMEQCLQGGALLRNIYYEGLKKRISRLSRKKQKKFSS